MALETRVRHIIEHLFVLNLTPPWLTPITSLPFVVRMSSSFGFHRSKEKKKRQISFGHLNNKRLGLSVVSLILILAFKPHPHRLFRILTHPCLLILEQLDFIETHKCNIQMKED